MQRLPTLVVRGRNCADWLKQPFGPSSVDPDHFAGVAEGSAPTWATITSARNRTRSQTASLRTSFVITGSVSGPYMPMISWACVPGSVPLRVSTGYGSRRATSLERSVLSSMFNCS